MNANANFVNIVFILLCSLDRDYSHLAWKISRGHRGAIKLAVRNNLLSGITTLVTIIDGTFSRQLAYDAAENLIA